MADENKNENNNTPPATPPTNGDNGDSKGDDNKDVIPKKSYDVVAEKLRAATERLKEYEKNKEADEEKRLKEQEKYKELAEKNEQKANDYKSKYEQSIVDNQIAIAAQKEGAVNPNAVLKLIDRGEIKLEDDGTVKGASEAVKALLEAEPYLKGSNKPTDTGSPSNPSNDDQSAKRFKMSQVQDPKFYAENKADILKAQSLGLIEDDTN